MTTREQQLSRKIILLILFFTSLIFGAFAQAETESNNTPAAAGVQLIYDNSGFSGTVANGSGDVDYWQISKTAGDLSAFTLRLDTYHGTSNRASVWLEKRSGSYDGTLVSNTQILQGFDGIQYHNINIDYSGGDFYYLLRVENDGFGDTYDYAVLDFNPASCLDPTFNTGVSITASSSGSLTINGLSFNNTLEFFNQRHIVSISDVNSFTNHADGPTDITVNTVYQGSGEQVVFTSIDGTLTNPNVVVTGLDPGTEYFVKATAARECTGYFKHSTGAVVSNSTCGVTPSAITAASVTPESETQIRISSFTGGAADHSFSSLGYVVKINTSNSFTTPADGASLPTANAVYGGGEQVVYAGSSATPNVAITGLSSLTTYYVQIYTYNLCDGSYYFEPTGFNSTVQTCGAPPSGYNNFMATTGGSVGVTQLAPVYNRDNYLVPSGLIVYINDVNSFTDPEATYTTLPTENSVYIGSGQQAVEVGGPSSFFATTTGLTPKTTYYFRSYPYFTCGGTSYVNLTDFQEITLTTCNFSDNLASSPVFGTITGNSMEFSSFTALSPTAPATAPDGYVIKINTSNTFTSIANGTPVPTGNTVYAGSGEQVIYAGNSTTPNLNITGLSANTTYYFNIVAHYPSCDGTIRYQQSGYTFSKSNDTGLTEPTITFNDINKSIGDADFNLLATSNSGGVITYQILSQTGTEATTLSGTNNATVTLGTAGTVTIEATQAPSGGFAGGAATATLNITAPDAAISGDPFLLINSTLDLSTQISSNSSGAISYSIIGDALGSSVIGNTFTSGSTIGNVILKVSQASTAQYAATDFYILVLIWDGTTFKSDRPFNLFDATVGQGEAIQLVEANSFLDSSPVTYTIVAPDPTGSSVDNATNVFTAGLAGTVTLRATSADGTYYNASSKDVTITINGDPQTITFNPLADVNLGDAAFNLSATASSGLAVSYASSNAAVATISGSIVTIVGEGATNITASQSGGGTFAPAADVIQSLTVNPIVLADQTVSASVTSGVCELTTFVSLGSTQSNVNYYLRDNSDNSVIEGPIVGTGAGISFTAETLAVSKTYEVYAELGSSSLVMTDKPAVTVDALADQTVLLSQANATSADVSLDGSQAGVDYYLRNDANNVVVQGPLAGTGSSVAFTTESIAENTTYNVLAASRGGNDLLRGVLQLDGVDDYISVPRIVDEEANITHITCETWVYLPSTDDTDVNASIITHEEFDGGFGMVVPFYINITGGNIFAGHNDPDDGGVYNTTPVSYPKDQWFHVAATFNRSTIILYLNGIQVSSVATPSVPNATFDGAWRIGRNHEATIDATKVIGGKLTDTRVWTGARSAAQIASGMNTTVPGQPLLNYLYTATSGTLIADVGLSPNETGTLNNAAGDHTNWVGSEVFLTGACSQQMGNTVSAVTKTEVTASNIVFNAPVSLEYDNTAKTYTITPDDGLNPTLPAEDVDLTYEGRNGTTYANSPTAPVNAGDYTVTATVSASNPDYQGSVSTDFSIAAKPITVTTDASQSKIYGNADPGFTYTVTSGSLELGDSFSGSLSRASGENVGNYAITEGTLSAGSNYDQSFVSNDFSVTTRSIEITSEAKSKTYGDADPALTYQLTSGALQFSDALSGSLARAAGENVGAYAINQGTLDAGGNYSLTYVSSDLTINTREIEITADAKSKTYGDADPALTYQLTSGTLQFSDALSGALTRATGENVGTHAINQGTVTAGSNYMITFVSDDLTIGARAIEVTADSKNKTYGDADPSLTYQITSGALQFSDAISGSPSRVAGENIGTYAINQGTLDAGGNYTFTYISDDLTIGTRAIEITADAVSKTYGDSDPTLTYQITSGALQFSDAVSGTMTRVAGEDIGTYIINKGTIDVGSNYVLTFVPGDLTINARSLFVRADSEVKTYGDSDPAFTPIIASGSLVSGDLFTGSLTRDAGEDVGAYTIRQGTLTAGSNYSITFLSTGSLSITGRAITVTADAKSKVYGDPDPSLTYQVTSGSLLGGDAFSGSLGRAAGEIVGTYAVNVGNLTAGANYLVSFVSDDLTISARAITVTADPQLKTYGDADPIFTYQISSGALQFSDSFTGSLARATGEDIGPYAIDAGSLSAGSNYEVTFVSDDLTIGTRPITVTADPVEKTFGEADPVLTYAVTGSLQFSDAFSGTLARTVGEDAGTYAINQGTLSLSANYDLSYIGDDFTINKASQIVTFVTGGSHNIAEGSAIVLNATGGASGNPVTFSLGANSAGATLEADGVTLIFGNAGFVFVHASQAGNTNYDAGSAVIQISATEEYIWSGAAWNSGSVPPANKDVLFEGDYVISGTLEVAAATLDAGVTLTIPDGAVLISNTEVDSDGSSLVVESGGSLVLLGDALGADFTINRNVTGSGGYSIVGSAVQGATAMSLGADYLYGFDGSNFTVPATTDALLAGQGFFAGYIAGSPSVSLTGTPNTGNQSYNLPSSGQFHLVSNPYAAPLSHSALVAGNTSFDGTIYLWDDGGANSGGLREGGYVTVNAAGMATGSGGLQGSGAFQGEIGTAQGFFIYADAATSIDFTPSMQSAVAGDNADGQFYRVTEPQMLRLTASQNDVEDDLLIALMEGGTKGFDAGLDARKLSNAHLSFFSMLGEEKLAIQALPYEVDEQYAIPLGWESQEASEVTFTVEVLEGLKATTNIYLADLETGERYDLRVSESMTFTLSQGSYLDRFELQFSTEEVLGEMEIAGQVEVYGNMRQLTILYPSANEKEEVIIYTLDGKVLFSEQVRFGATRQAIIEPDIQVETLYLMRIGDQVVKFFIR